MKDIKEGGGGERQTVRKRERESTIEGIMQTETFILTCQTKETYMYVATDNTIIVQYKLTSTTEKHTNTPTSSSLSILTLTICL